MKAVFVELPAFEHRRADYLDDDAFRRLAELLMKHPEAGDPMPDTGGLRKLRFADARRGIPSGDFLRSRHAAAASSPWDASVTISAGSRDLPVVLR